MAGNFMGAAIQGLNAAAPPTRAEMGRQNQPLGFADLWNRANENRNKYRRENPMAPGNFASLWDPARPTPGGPAPDPKWDAWFQALEDQGVTGLAAFGKSPQGSNQLTGTSAQNTIGPGFTPRRETKPSIPLPSPMAARRTNPTAALDALKKSGAR